MHCRSCNHDIQPFFSLGDMPPVNSFLSTQHIDSEKKFELTVAFCPSCFLVQITKTVPPEELFRDYIYFSSTSKTILEHNEKTATYLTNRLLLDADSLVLEIASNDGALLQYFKKRGPQVLGVDPAENIARVANERGIPTIPEFFNLAQAEKLTAEGKHADLIYGANVLAHVPEIVDFVRGVATVLKKEGAAVFEFPYLAGLFENKFDIIYHEHVFYYSLIALQNLFARTGLSIYDVEMVPMQGGSLRIFAAHEGTQQIRERVRELETSERTQGFDRFETYKQMAINVEKLKKELRALLTKLKADGKRVGVYSAPAKGVILMNYFGINGNLIDFVVDKSEAKQGLHMPGVHLLVHPLSKIYEQHTDYLIILCWNIWEEVVAMDELKQFKTDGGKFIVPIPQLRIV